MKETKQYENGVKAVIVRASAFNYEIGEYVEHFITERFTFLAALSNGRIEMSREIAQDQEKQPQSITDERIRAVAQSFQKDKAA